jgi:nitrate reductase (NAD(P)H)
MTEALPIAVAGTQPGGWMQRIKDEGQNPSKPNLRQGASAQQDPSIPSNKLGTSPVSMINPAVKRSITSEELQAHSAKENPWFAVDGEVRSAFGSLPMANSGISGL